jgi:hypothetical protein
MKSTAMLDMIAALTIIAIKVQKMLEIRYKNSRRLQ